MNDDAEVCTSEPETPAAEKLQWLATKLRQQLSPAERRALAKMLNQR